MTAYFTDPRAPHGKWHTSAQVVKLFAEPLVTGTAQGPRMIVPEKLQLYATRGQPKPCPICLSDLEDRLGVNFKKVLFTFLPLQALHMALSFYAKLLTNVC